MKRLIVVLSLVVSVSTFFALAQEKGEKKIRLKIEKIINGEKVIIDTTFKKFDGKTIKKFIGDDNLMEITINASDDCKSFKSESNTFYYTVDDDGKDEKKVFISCDKSGNHTIDIKEEEGEDGVIIKKVYIKSDCSDDAVNVSESKCYVYATGDSKSEKAHVIEMRKFIGDDNNDIESVNVTNTSETQAITIQKKDGESKTFDIHIDGDDKIVIYDDNGTVKGCNKNIKNKHTLQIETKLQSGVLIRHTGTSEVQSWNQLIRRLCYETNCNCSSAVAVRWHRGCRR